MKKLFETESSWLLLVQRVVLGGVMFAHGAQKLLGWFGGYGYEGTMGYFTGMVGLPYALGLLVIVAEFFGSLGLITGTLTRVGAFGIAAVMIGAVATSHMNVGFFMNWGGNLKGEGFEYHLLALAIAFPLMIKGGGLYSVDSFIARALNRGSVSRPEARPGYTAA